MPIYQFTGTDQTGAPSQGTFEAPNEEQALAQLAQYGLNVSQVVPMVTPSPSPSPVSPQEPGADAKPEKAKKNRKG
jgi:type II secretory pathway component PulF